MDSTKPVCIPEIGPGATASLPPPTDQETIITKCCYIVGSNMSVFDTRVGKNAIMCSPPYTTMGIMTDFFIKILSRFSREANPLNESIERAWIKLTYLHDTICEVEWWLQGQWGHWEPIAAGHTGMNTSPVPDWCSRAGGLPESYSVLERWICWVLMQGRDGCHSNSSRNKGCNRKDKFAQRVDQFRQETRRKAGKEQSFPQSNLQMVHGGRLYYLSEPNQEIYLLYP